jgi:hypothetical protein
VAISDRTPSVANSAGKRSRKEYALEYGTSDSNNLAAKSTHFKESLHENLQYWRHRISLSPSWKFARSVQDPRVSKRT